MPLCHYGGEKAQAHSHLSLDNWISKKYIKIADGLVKN